MKLKKIKFAIIFILSTVGLYTQAQSLARQHEECSNQILNPYLHCANPLGGTDNVSLIITEFQDCDTAHEKITAVQRLLAAQIKFLKSNTAKINLTDSSDQSIYINDVPETFLNKDIQVEYFTQRTHFDQYSGHVSMLLPKTAKLKTSGFDYEINFSEKKCELIDESHNILSTPCEINKFQRSNLPIELNYDWQVVGEFKKIDSKTQKVIQSGPMVCTPRM